MANLGSWSVKGIDDRARAVAKEEARKKGMTLGDYINNLLLDGHSEAGPRDSSEARLSKGQPRSIRSAPPRDTATLDGLATRIEAVEARSTLAITGIDQSVLGLLARLDNAENMSASVAADVERVIDEFRETQEVLQQKIQTLELDDRPSENLEAVKSLEQALGKLAAHVHEENGLHQDESFAIKGRVESGFADLSERVVGMEIQVEQTLSQSAQRVEKAVAEAELRAEGTTRHLSERFSTIETDVATKLAKVDEMAAQMDTVTGDVSGAIGSMEGTLLRIQERLNRAESTTDSALKGLEQTFEHLDERISAVAESANPEHAEALRKQFETRFEGMSADLRMMVEQARVQLANEIERAAANGSPEKVRELDLAVTGLKDRLSEGETRTAEAVVDIQEQVTRISDGLDTRLTQLEEMPAEAIKPAVREAVNQITGDLETRLDHIEQRGDDALEQLSGHMTALADQLETRITSSEEVSAAAIQQVGEHVASAVVRLKAQHETGLKSLEDRLSASDERHDARLSKALSNVSERLTEMQQKTVHVVSPVQKAIASLAMRLEDLESYNTPPGIPVPDSDLPDMPDPTVDATAVEGLLPEPDAPVFEDYSEVSEPALPDLSPSFVEDEVSPLEASDEDYLNTEDTAYETPENDANFVAGFEEITAEEDASPADDAINEFTDWHAQFQAAATETDPITEEIDAHEPDSANPLEDLGNWDDGLGEAREADIFAEDGFIDPDEAASSLPTEASDQFVSDIPDPDIQLVAEDETDDENDLDALDKEPDFDADYLTRARNAAIAAAQSPDLRRQKANSKQAPTYQAGKPAKSKSNRLPIYAAASVLALSAAGAGAYMTLRGKQTVADTGFSIPADTQTDSAALASAAVAPNTEEASIETALIDDLDADLFDLDASEAAIDGELLSGAAIANPIGDDAPRIAKPTTLQAAALRGDPIAELKLGEQFLADKNYVKAAEFIGSAARQNLAPAQYRFAKLHEAGLGVPRDLTTARQWTERAAKGGNVKAMHDLAVYFAEGDGGEQSYAGAAQWFRSAADYGLIDSQFNLAVLYETGLGVSPSVTEALFWFEVAAKTGDPSAPDRVDELREKLSIEDAKQIQRRAATWAPVQAAAIANEKYSDLSWEYGNQTQVRAVQSVLNELGYDVGTPDGLFGAGTRTAVALFQSDYGLNASGDIDSELVDALNALVKSDA